ncbi:MAG: hypothetical protein AAFX50_02470 [Acidobacteriota bacterium]
MTTFFQMAQSMDPGSALDVRRLVEAGTPNPAAPQSALLLNPIPHLPRFEAPRRAPKPANENSPRVARLG